MLVKTPALPQTW